nr:hypothetical protein [Candidatus Gracilibacteria bacterium]
MSKLESNIYNEAILLKGINKYDLIDLLKELWVDGWEEMYLKFLKIKGDEFSAFMNSLYVFVKEKAKYKEKVSGILNLNGSSDIDLKLGVLNGQRGSQFAFEIAKVLKISSEKINDLVVSFSGKINSNPGPELLYSPEGLKFMWDDELKGLFENEMNSLSGRYVSLFSVFLTVFEKSKKYPRLAEAVKGLQKNKLNFLKFIRPFKIKSKGDNLSIEDLLTFLECAEYYKKMYTKVRSRNIKGNNISILPNSGEYGRDTAKGRYLSGKGLTNGI